MDNSPIIKRIELRLAELNMSKAEFYKKSGISSASYSQWNTNVHEPTHKMLAKIARCLDLEIDYLRNGELDAKKAPTAGESSERNEKRELAIQLTEDLTEAEMQQVQDYVAFLKSRRNQ